MFKQVLLLMLTCGFLNAGYAAEPVQPRLSKVDSGRHFGIVTGDIIEQRFHIVTDRETALSQSSLPTPGAINYWLDLVNVDYQQANQGKHREHLVTIRYQTFYAPLDVRRLTIPPQELMFLYQDRVIPVSLPTWDFYMSPIKEIAPRAVGASATETAFMQPDIIPHTIDTRDKSTITWLSVLLVTCLTLFGLNNGIFGISYSPFANARRRIKKLARDNNPQTILSAYREVHLAFNRYAGQALFSHQIGDFLNNHPEFMRLGNAIDEFYKKSEKILFAEQTDAQQQQIDYLQHFCRLLAKAEHLAKKSR